jgi:Predicted phosphohydrolases
MYTKRITQLISQTVLCIFLVSALCGCASAHPRSEIDASNIHTCTLTIPGLSRDYDLLFLTDTHIVIPDESAASEIQSYSEERLAHFTGEGGRISSDLFTAWMEYANQMEPDALLLGGDIIDSPSSANVKYLSASLDSLKVPYLYTLGNHDWTFPWDYMTETGTAEYLPLLAPYMETNTAIHTLELDDLIVVAVDNSNNQIHPDALEEYQRILSRKKPVILLLHVPFYTEELLAKTSAVWPNGVVLGGGVHGGIYPNDVSAQFMSLTTAADSPVAAVLAGHVHLSDESVIDGEKDIPQIVGDAGYKGKGTLIHITAE